MHILHKSFQSLASSLRLPSLVIIEFRENALSLETSEPKTSDILPPPFEVEGDVRVTAPRGGGRSRWRSRWRRSRGKNTRISKVKEFHLISDPFIFTPCSPPAHYFFVPRCLGRLLKCVPRTSISHCFFFDGRERKETRKLSGFGYCDSCGGVVGGSGSKMLLVLLQHLFLRSLCLSLARIHFWQLEGRRGDQLRFFSRPLCSPGSCSPPTRILGAS